MRYVHKISSLIITLFALTIGTALSHNPTLVGEQARSSPSRSTILKSCTLEGVPGTAQCGTYEVFEDRTRKTGRKIPLKILLLPATGSERSPDPFVYIPGGPGSSATEDAPYLAQELAKIRERRDLLFVDQRGTGGSNALDCELFDPNNPQSYLGYFFPLESVRKCREQLEKKADLTLYTTTIAMDDFDEVRAALGYEKLNLFGASYGTRAALVYLRQHPQHVRTVVLHGVSPTNHYMPADFAQQTERALQGVLAECAADEICGKAFPNVHKDAKTVLERLLKGPIEVEVRNANSERGDSAAGNNSARSKVSLSRDLAAEAVRYMLYHPAAANQIPLVLNSAAQGNFVPLAEAALRSRRNIVATGSNGMYLSVTCAEDLPWIKEGVGERLAANTFLGDYRLRQQREACALWPRGKIPADYAKPVSSKAPVLILTGEWDPVTPPSNGDEAARHLTNSVHLVVPHGGHGFGGLEGTECIEQVVTAFVGTATVKDLDASCIKKIKRKGWGLPAARSTSAGKGEGERD
jgi:pimeloyl-ACP methyl ester carboxylesterase